MEHESKISRLGQMNSAIINLEVYGGGINKYLFANSEAGRLDTFGI